MLSELGLTVSRTVPAELLPGLLSSAYTLHGGVVRDVGGQIVSHLALPASDALSLVSLTPASAATAAVSALTGNLQAYQLAQDVQRVANIAMASTVLSGLGLATALIGFRYVARGVQRVSQSIEQLKDKSEQIKGILQSQQRSQLLGAVDDYRLSSTLPQEKSPKQLLLRAQRSFGDLAHYYKSRVAESSELAEVEASEGYFVIAAIGNAICSSDLGFWDTARDDLRNHYNDWRKLARQQCAQLLDLTRPEALLHERYVEHLPARSLVKLLDFSNETDRGIEWLDYLRRPRKKRRLKVPKRSRISKEAIDLSRTLQARDDVLSSYVAHFNFLAEKKISAREFSTALEDRREREGADLVWASQPATS